MKIIGLTGGIASGKSTVSKMFADQKIPVIDTDKIARDQLNKDTEAYHEVVSQFSHEILHTNGDVDRKKLGRVIFGNPLKRQKLNDIIHPRVKEEVFEQLKQLEKANHKLIVVDVPLLYETDFFNLVDAVVVVYCSYEQQISRLMDRDHINKEYAMMKINAQLSLEEKKEKADYVVDNSFSILNTKVDFNNILKELEVT